MILETKHENNEHFLMIDGEREYTFWKGIFKGETRMESISRLHFVFNINGYERNYEAIVKIYEAMKIGATKIK